MLDDSNLQQQEALGVLGVNLIYAAFELHRRPEAILDTLIESLDTNRIEIDYRHFGGVPYDQVDKSLDGFIFGEIWSHKNDYVLG